MDSRPNKTRGVKTNDFPYSLSDKMQEQQK